MCVSQCLYVFHVFCLLLFFLFVSFAMFWFVFILFGCNYYFSAYLLSNERERKGRDLGG